MLISSTSLSKLNFLKIKRDMQVSSTHISPVLLPESFGVSRLSPLVLHLSRFSESRPPSLFYLIVSHADVDLHNCFFGWHHKAPFSRWFHPAIFNFLIFNTSIQHYSFIFNPVWLTLQFVYTLDIFEYANSGWCISNSANVRVAGFEMHRSGNFRKGGLCVFSAKFSEN